MRRGEVWWADLPEPYGHRPVVVLTRNEVVNSLEGIVVCVVTTRHRGLASEVPIGRDEGLRVRCVANLDNILTVRKDRLIQNVGALSGVKLLLLNQALRFALGVP